MDLTDWQQAQRHYYDKRRHGHLEPQQGGVYAKNLTRKLRDRIGISEQSHGLEIGCGAGRFTIPLLQYFRTLEVADLSTRQLSLLEEELKQQKIDETRCVLHHADVEKLDEVLPQDHFDFVIGVFVLHHLVDPADTVERLSKLVKPGGRLIFLEPNRWNPLFTLQILLLPDFSFAQEKRLYQLGTHRLRRFLSEAGLDEVRSERTGFFPPQVINRCQWALALEQRIEAVRLFNPMLPFLIISGTRPDREN